MTHFTIIDADQRSDAWRLSRCGRLCGSRAGDMLATIKTGEAAARRDLKAQLVVERLTGIPQDDVHITAAMQHGIDTEAAAIATYEAITGNLVRRTGFLAHTELLAGCSLDGDVQEFTGIVETKCPKSATHLRYLKSGGKLPPEYLGQVTHNLWISGARWCDFVSFDPRFPPALQFLCVRVPRDEAAMASYKLAVRLFLSEVEKDMDEMQRLMERAA